VRIVVGKHIKAIIRRKERKGKERWNGQEGPRVTDTEVTVIAADRCVREEAAGAAQHKTKRTM
jgi:hypothetical protein